MGFVFFKILKYNTTRRDSRGSGGGLAFYSYVDDVNTFIDVFGLSAYIGKKRGPKTKDDGGPHNDKIGDIAKKLQDDGWVIEAGGNVKPEILVKTGGKKDRRPDIIAKKEGKTKVINVGKNDSKGNPVPREIDAKADLEKVYGQGNVDFVPYN